MKISIITAFPDLVRQPVQESILKQAQKKTDITISVYDLRDYAYDKHKIVDDYPYGGGYGMVLKPEPYFEALEDVI
ncbi:MAG: tRNA (guanosine(37)-N1)-methyltransferase TrmD, partial [Calditrichia bacterium]|nr:tRNA (guanosine(37)-N1)-methyltransferase TrmD [Calditrichia bacterium]